MFCLRHISLDSQYVEVMNPNISHFYLYEGQIIYKTYTLVLILIENYFLNDHFKIKANSIIVTKLLSGMYMQNNLRQRIIYNI